MESRQIKPIAREAEKRRVGTIALPRIETPFLDHSFRAGLGAMSYNRGSNGSLGAIVGALIA
jgi:hypothetical protein